MNSNLFIRADGSTEMGLGHLVRCISLSTILQDDFNITFVCKQIPKQIKNELAQQGIALCEIDNEEQFFDLLPDQSVVVLDGYSFGPEYQKKIRKKSGILACIDDVHDREFYADLIINHAPGITKKQYSAQSYTKYALGLEFALLRPPFLEAALKIKDTDTKNLETLLICFGGSDSENLTLRGLNVVSDFNQFKKIIIITGSAYRFKNELLRKIKDNKAVEYHHALSGIEMAGAFLNADIAIVPSSGILFEALATGNVAVSGTYTENQKEVYSGFKKLNAIIDAGRFSEKEIREAILIANTHKTRKKLIDGKSPERIRMLFHTIKRD